MDKLVVPSGNLYKRQSYLGIPVQALMLRAGAPSSYSPRSIAGAFCLVGHVSFWGKSTEVFADGRLTPI